MIRTFLVAALLLFTVSDASARTTAETCYRSLPELRQVHKTEHAWHHTTPRGQCYHIGQRNHSKTFAVTKPSPSKGGSIISWTKIKEDKLRMQWMDYELARHIDWRPRMPP